MISEMTSQCHTCYAYQILCPVPVHEGFYLFLLYMHTSILSRKRRLKVHHRMLQYSLGYYCEN